MKLQMDNVSVLAIQETDSKHIYKLVSIDAIGSETLCLRASFELVCGWDYVDPDNSDVQGYVSANAFIDDVEVTSFIFYPLTETLLSVMEDEGFVQLPKVPNFKVLDLNEDFEDMHSEGASGNMHCDNTGYCCESMSCPNYSKCKQINTSC